MSPRIKIDGFPVIKVNTKTEAALVRNAIKHGPDFWCIGCCSYAIGDKRLYIHHKMPGREAYSSWV